ncbi:ketosteroid isomerase-like protein [Sphingomonas sp. UYP23]
MISPNHLNAYLEAMGRRDVEGTKAHMADDVVIHSPIVPAPFHGALLQN